MKTVCGFFVCLFLSLAILSGCSSSEKEPNTIESQSPIQAPSQEVKTVPEEKPVLEEKTPSPLLELKDTAGHVFN